jgi:hypothetical protein
MRRGIRNLLVRKPDGKTGEAAATDEPDDAVDDPLGNTAWGLDVWVHGVEPTVEYVSLIAFQSPTCYRSCVYLTAANRRIMILALSQSTALMAIGKRPGRPKTT